MDLDLKITWKHPVYSLAQYNALKYFNTLSL